VRQGRSARGSAAQGFSGTFFEKENIGIIFRSLGLFIMSSTALPFLGFVSLHHCTNADKFQFHLEAENQGNEGGSVDLGIALDIATWSKQCHLAEGRKTVITFEQQCPSIILLVILRHLETKGRDTNNVVSKFYCSVAIKNDPAHDAQYSFINDLETGRFFYAEQYAQFLGFSSAQELESIMKSPADGIHPDDLPIVRQVMQRIAAGHSLAFESIELRRKRKDGSFIWVVSRITRIDRDTEGKPLKVYGVIFDIDARKRLELETLAAKESLDRMIEDAPFPMFKAKIDSSNCYANEAYCKLTGMTKDQCQGFGWLKLMEPKFADGLKKAQETWAMPNGPSTQIVTRITTPQGEKKYVQLFWNSHRVVDHANGLSLGMFIDVTNEVVTRKRLENKTKELELALEEAARVTKSKTDFLAVVSHEVRTPLNAIMGMTALLKDTPLNAEQLDMLTTMESGQKTMLSLVNDVLDFSKIEAGSMTLDLHDVNLRAEVSSVYHMLKVCAINKGLQCLFEFDSGFPETIRVDGVKLKRVLLNLFGNAIKFTTTGHVKLQCKITNNQPSVISCRFIVDDTGAGIDETGMKRLFQPFSQADSSIR
jgi:PAS domain S-box-containing protein